LEMATTLAADDDTWVDIALKFVEHFALIVDAMHAQDLWDDEDGFFYDVFRTPDGVDIPIKVRSIVGVLPLLATVVIGPTVLGPADIMQKRFAQFLERYDHDAHARRGQVLPGDSGDLLLVGVIPPGDGRRVLDRVFDTDEFLSPHGLRALSKAHAAEPVRVDLAGVVASADYEPGESTNGMFGGNSNWRGPVWMPVNVLLLRGMQRWARTLGEGLTFEYPTGSGHTEALATCAEDLRRRLIGLFLRDGHGHRPSSGDSETLQHHPRWRDMVLFHEYFHGDTGSGLGASHQTGWTGLVADLIVRPDPYT
jgi:hypothetical protein